LLLYHRCKLKIRALPSSFRKALLLVPRLILFSFFIFSSKGNPHSPDSVFSEADSPRFFQKVPFLLNTPFRSNTLPSSEMSSTALYRPIFNFGNRLAGDQMPSRNSEYQMS